MSQNRTSVKIDKSVRDRLKSQKKGGETYNQLIDKMVKQYDPQNAEK